MVKIVLLAGGKGTRLRPYTYLMPKPLLPINQKPIMEHIIENLKDSGFEDIIITVGYLGYQIKNYFGNGRKWGVNIEYAEETKPLGNAGSLFPIKDKLKDDDFLVVAGDNLSNLDYKRFYEYHKEKDADATIALIEIETKIEFGLAELDEKTNLIKGFVEKPTLKHFAATMIYAFKPSVLDYIYEGADFGKNVFPSMLKDGKKIYGYVHDDFWIDVGRVSDYEKLMKS